VHTRSVVDGGSAEQPSRYSAVLFSPFSARKAARIISMLALGVGLASGCAGSSPPQVSSEDTDEEQGASMSDDDQDEVADSDDEDPSSPGDGDASEPVGTGDGDEQSGSPEDPVPSDPTPDEPVQTSNTLHLEGRDLIDTCGNRFVVRGVEQILGRGITVGGSLEALIDEIAKSGANAVRVLPTLADFTVDELDALLSRITAHGLVVFLSPGDRSWFARSDVHAMLDKHKSMLIIDAFQEPNYDDRTLWKADAISSIQAIRELGYTVPLTVLANQFGRDLPVLLEQGAEVIAADPLTNTILGWQAYWGVSGYYEQHYGMSLAEAVSAAARQEFPIQAGIDGFADPADALNYPVIMQQAQTEDVGWLWWDWYNPYGPLNSLSQDGTATNLTALGTAVVPEASNGLRSAQKACGSPGG
jgi:hypothetical protein